MLIFLVYMASVSSLYDSFPLFWIGNAPLHSQSHKIPHPPSSTQYLSAGEVIEVAGSNPSIGVILNLAWGPNNFSPSMIWSCRTRSNSQTGLGAELLLPMEFIFCFCCFFYFFPLLSPILSSFFLFFQRNYLFRSV